MSLIENRKTIDAILTETDDIPLIEGQNIPVIYTDGPAAVEILGQNVRITYFEYRTIAGERVKSPTLEMIRPLKSCLTGAVRILVERKLAETGRSPRH